MDSIKPTNTQGSEIQAPEGMAGGLRSVRSQRTGIAATRKRTCEELGVCNCITGWCCATNEVVKRFRDLRVYGA